MVPTQLKSSVTYGFVVFGALNFLTYTDNGMVLRLYRPGFELVEVKSWDIFNPVVWKPARDFQAQEKVLDALFPSEKLNSGKESTSHRDALLFGALEYERLAERSPSFNQQAFLNEKARKLRELANSNE